jgi:hypothetical protein
MLNKLFKKKYDAGYEAGVNKAIKLAQELLRKKDFNDLTPRMAVAILVILLKREIKED